MLDKNTALQQLAESAAANDKRQKRIVFSEGGGINKIKKKDKMKMRKELLQKKIHVMKLIKEEEKGEYAFEFFTNIYLSTNQAN